MSRLAWLFSDIEIQNLGNNRIIAALGDGYGGYTQVINQMTSGSRIIFKTSPTSLNEQPVPTLYSNYNEMNEVDTYLIEIDRWDLTEWSNFIRLELHKNNPLDIVYCDAELPNKPESASEYLKVWHNICTYAVMNCMVTKTFVIISFILYIQLILFLCT